MPTTGTRVARARAAIEAYRKFTGDVEDESHFPDLLTDMMHLAEADGINFEAELERARGNFEADEDEEE